MRVRGLRSWSVVVCLLTAIALHAYDKASPRTVKVRVDRCVLLPPQQRPWLGQEWERFLPFVRSCEVKRGNSPPIYVLAISAEDFEATLPRDAPAERLPKPLVASSDGRVLGRLPIGFPDDPPRSSEVSFSDWVRGFPRQIQISVNDPTVLGDRVIVMDWYPTAKTYVSRQKEKVKGSK